jgi:tetratricopeptide (TPR) repeat protein
MELGRLDEAEDSLNRAAALAESTELNAGVGGRGWGGPGAMEREIRESALCTSTLGDLRMEQGRFDDAVKCYEASLRDWPGHGPFHAQLAAACLCRGGPAEEAVKCATEAVELDRSSKGGEPEVHNMNLSEDLAALAWAVATASKEQAQVYRLVDEATTLSTAASVPTLAQVRFRSGLAYAALGDDARARTFWEEASRIDAQGRWGRAARAKLAEPR